MPMTAPRSAPLRSDFLRVLTERGFVHQCTDLEGLDALAAKGRIVAYDGFDCTAPSLHIGNLVGIMMLHWLQQTGHKPIALMGGGTTRIGDPSGKDDARKLLSEADIAGNMAGIKRVFANFLTFGDRPGDALMVNNADWLDQLEYIAFLRDYGRHFSVNRMLSFDSVKLRLEREQPLTFLEFNYMVLQAYDFVELKRRHDCVLQVGGSDQWGNIVNGVELARRLELGELFGLTAPLITMSSGAKMGKTAKGAVWLNAEQLAPYDYWQFWRNTEDADVGRFLRVFTTLPLDEIVKLEALQGQELNEAKKILANEATALCHGGAAAEAAAETARKTFEEGALAEDLPTVFVSQAKLDAGIATIELVVQAGFAASNGEARRLVRAGGIRINDHVLSDETHKTSSADLQNGVIKLSVGKKRHALIKPV
jgi:tyrosyl-tRNA synthetase